MNQLKHRQEFETILRDYGLPQPVASLLTGIKLVLLVGPSAAGRNTIIDRLVENGGYQQIVSDTTRTPRFNNGIKEENGVVYWFRSEEEFLEGLKKHEFLEAEIIHGQQVSGISIRELKKVHESGKIAINDVDIGGFLNIMSRKPDTIGVYVLPPSFDTWLERIKSRGELPAEEILNRLKTGLRIFEEAGRTPNAHLVVNAELAKSVEAVDRLAHGLNTQQIGNVKALLEELTAQTEEYLKQHYS